MKTKTGWFILLITALLLCVGYFCGRSLELRSARAARVQAHLVAADSLAWMRKDFSLSDAEFAKICALHDAYQPQCDAMCADIAAATARLSRTLEEHGQITPEVEAALRDYESTRARCQRGTLGHLLTTASAMKPAAGRAFLHAVLPHLLGGHQHINEVQHPAGTHE